MNLCILFLQSSIIKHREFPSLPNTTFFYKKFYIFFSQVLSNLTENFTIQKVLLVFLSGNFLAFGLLMSKKANVLYLFVQHTMQSNRKHSSHKQISFFQIFSPLPPMRSYTRRKNKEASVVDILEELQLGPTYFIISAAK